VVVRRRRVDASERRDRDDTVNSGCMDLLDHPARSRIDDEQRVVVHVRDVEAMSGGVDALVVESIFCPWKRSARDRLQGNGCRADAGEEGESEQPSHVSEEGSPTTEP